MAHFLQLFQDGLDRSSAAIPIAEMRSFGILERKPLIAVLLQCIDGFVARLPQRYADELFGDGSVEPFDRSVRLG